MQCTTDVGAGTELDCEYSEETTTVVLKVCVSGLESERGWGFWSLVINLLAAFYSHQKFTFKH